MASQSILMSIIRILQIVNVSTLLCSAAVFAVGFLIEARRHWFRGAVHLSKDTEIPSLDIEELADIIDDFKMFLVVRNDLKMGKGKIAEHCSHAALGLYKKMLKRAPKSLKRWEMCGQVKVVVKVESEVDMLVLQEMAKLLNIPTRTVIDAGRTQIAPNSITVMAILAPAEVVDVISGGLTLL